MGTGASSTKVPSDLNQSIVDDGLNGSLSHNNCTNDYCITDEEYVDMIESYIFPTPYEWIMVGLHGVVFVVGLVGNLLVCLAVYRNHSMRTVTNYFIVNLAVADFLVILLCLPPTVVWDITETWFMGTPFCKIVLYFQTVSVAVSVLTLTFISVDRWYAICFPLKFKSTTSRAKKSIALIWVLALAFDLPELVVLRAQRKDLRVDSHLLTQCAADWGPGPEMAFQVLKTLLLYTAPLAFMSLAYWQIARVLWRPASALPGGSSAGDNGDEGSNRSQGRRSLPVRAPSGPGGGVRRGFTAGSGPGVGAGAGAGAAAETQMRARRKAAKMLVAVVAMFAVCYLPVHLMGILRYTIGIPQTEFTVALALVSHWLCYANSAANPLIYNFMSGKFRKEFRRTFGWIWCTKAGPDYSLRDSGAPMAGNVIVGQPAGSSHFYRSRRSTVVLHLGRQSRDSSRAEVVPLHGLNGNIPD